MAKNAKTETAEKKVYTVDFDEYGIRGANGEIDQEATVTRFVQQLAEFAEQDCEVARTVLEAVHAAFDSQPKGVRMAMPTVTFATLQRLEGVDPSHIPALMTKIGNVVRHSAEFKVGRGKGGGVSRVCDIPPAEAAAEE